MRSGLVRGRRYGRSTVRSPRCLGSLRNKMIHFGPWAPQARCECENIGFNSRLPPLPPLTWGQAAIRGLRRGPRQATINKSRGFKVRLLRNCLDRYNPQPVRGHRLRIGSPKELLRLQICLSCISSRLKRSAISNSSLPL